MSLVYWKGGGTNLRPTQIGSYFGSEFLGVGLLLGVVSGTAALTVQRASLAAIGDMAYAGAATLSLGAIGIDAVANQPFAGDATLAVQGASLSGAGTTPGRLLANVESAVLDAVATLESAGAVTLNLAAAGLNAVGLVVHPQVGAGLLNLQGLVLDAVGAPTAEGAATFALADMDFAAAAFMLPAGVGTLPLQAAQLDAIGLGPGEFFGEIATVDLLANGVAGEVGTGNISLADLVLAATGQPGLVGTGSIQLQSAAFNAAGVGPGRMQANIADTFVLTGAGAAGEVTTGNIVLVRVALVGLGQMQIEAIGELNASSLTLFTIVAAGDIEVEPEPSTSFWTPSEFGTTTWATQ